MPWGDNLEHSMMKQWPVHGNFTFGPITLKIEGTGQELVKAQVQYLPGDLSGVPLEHLEESQRELVKALASVAQEIERRSHGG